MVVLSFDLDVSFTKKERHLFVKTNVFIYLYLEASLVFKTITLQIVAICRQMLLLIFLHCYINIGLCLRYRYETCNKHFINYTDFFISIFFLNLHRVS